MSPGTVFRLPFSPIDEETTGVGEELLGGFNPVGFDAILIEEPLGQAFSQVVIGDDLPGVGSELQGFGGVDSFDVFTAESLPGAHVTQVRDPNDEDLPAVGWEEPGWGTRVGFDVILRGYIEVEIVVPVGFPSLDFSGAATWPTNSMYLGAI